ncbi:MAG: fructose PTS transporter subunit IIB [Tetragenococcus koreensis]|nr:fructose PTS transporter subunit IIB [Tetragenococcus koreensis]
MKIIAITSCATGIAHTYMAAQAIKKICKQKGHDCKVEVQGALGIENELTQQDIQGADIIVLANDVKIQKGERFEGLEKNIIHTNPHEVIKKPKLIFERA